MNKIEKASVVKYKGGYYRISALFKTTANLTGVFTGKIYHKKVPLTELNEAHDEWYAKWQESETYKSM